MIDVSVLDPTDLPAKEPHDEVPYQLDFERALPDGDSIFSVDSSVVCLRADGVGSEVDIPAMKDGDAQSSGTIAQQWVTGGTTGVAYKWIVQITSAFGLKLEREGVFIVLDR